MTIKTPHPLSAAILLIGNELLSGRIGDKNLAWIAKQLGFCGISVVETRIVQDNEEDIIDAIYALQKKAHYIFTTGGIGPTHDDITSEAIAKALNLPFICHPEARTILEEYYGDRMTDARLSMAYMPEGAVLLYNPATKAPGFMVHNIYVLPGIPSVMQAIFAQIIDQLHTGPSFASVEYVLRNMEGDIAEDLTTLQKAHPEVTIGSYPLMKENHWGTCLVLRTADTQKLKDACGALDDLIIRNDWTHIS